MISLSYKNSKCGGVVKKMLHVPTMTLHSVKETSMHLIKKPEILTRIEMLSEINKRCAKLVKVTNCFFNQPEGAMSIALEYMEGNSLECLINHSGIIHTLTIIKIMRSVLEVITDYHQGLSAIHEARNFHGNVSTGQVLFTRQGRVKLGVSCIITRAAYQNSISLAEEARNDVKQLGTVALCCLFGELEQTFDSFSDFFCKKEENLNYFLKKRGVPEDLILFVNDCFSTSMTSSELLSHPIFKIQSVPVNFSPNFDNEVRLEEMIQLANDWISACDPQFAKGQLERIAALIEVILLKSQHWFEESRISLLNDLIFMTESTRAVKEISSDLGLPVREVLNKFSLALSKIPSISNLKTHLRLLN